MAMASLKDLYFAELGDLYDAETQTIRTLPRLAEAARAPELRDALTKHCEESRLHVERLELIFTHWGERRRATPCAGLAGIVQEADDRLNQPATDDARDAAIIGVAQRIEHYEIAAYGCARTYARRLNRPDEARLLQETLDEEGRTDRRLTEMAEAHINDDARAESDFAGPSPKGRLKYVPLTALDRGRTEPLPVRNDSDRELGRLDGLVVDATASAARYIVVHAGSVLTHRRYLLPLALVRYDEPAGVLRVSVDENVASRYPRFDGDEFEAMSERDREGYEAGLLEYFPRAQPPARTGADLAAPPDWLMTGAWVTASPDRVSRLSEDARRFTNEFNPRSGASGSKEMVARESTPERASAAEDPPPSPHGDKLR